MLAPLGLRLSPTKTRVCHLDEGFDFLGFHIQRRRKKGTSKYHVYTYPSKKALASIMGKVRTLTNGSRHKTLADLLHQLKQDAIDAALMAMPDPDPDIESIPLFEDDIYFAAPAGSPRTPARCRVRTGSESRSRCCDRRSSPAPRSPSPCRPGSARCPRTSA